MAQKKISFILLFRVAVLPAILVFFILFFLTYQTPLEIFPENDTLFEYSTVSDGNFEDGNSSSSFDTSNRHLKFEYTLGDKNETPYAMLIFHAHELFRSINLKQYKSVEIYLHPEESSDFTLTLYTYVPGFSDPGNSDTHRPYSLICRPHGTEKLYRYALDDFATPGWWFSAFNLGEEDVPKSDWEQITHLSISDATRLQNKPLQITIEKIRFTDSLGQKLLFAALCAVLYLLIYFAVSKQLRIRKNRKIKQRLYHPGAKTSYTPEDKDKLILFLSENYSDPLLTLEKIEKQIGLNQFQVSEIISDTYKMRYKQYLNHIRLEVAKKLLTTTDNPISAIAEEVGYCYSNSFSRAFRQSEEMTPNQYRKSMQNQESE